jgi:hypothetical protein
MNSTKRYTPTTTARPTWREREAQKERQQREAVAKAAEEQRVRAFANTEENFPTIIKPVEKMTVYGGPQGKFLELVNKMQSDDDAFRTVKKARRKTVEYNPALFIRHRRRQTYDDEDDYESTIAEEPVNLSELYPAHGKRGYSGPPDSEGWRLVTRKTRQQPRELTEADLVRKYREEFFGEGEDDDDVDHNGDLTDRNQRREFY